jgi:hypothetical protein
MCTDQVDTLLGTINESLDAMGGWDNADSHYSFHSHEKVTSSAFNHTVNNQTSGRNILPD